MTSTIGLKVPAKTEAEIERAAKQLRDLLGVGDSGRIKAVKVIEDGFTHIRGDYFHVVDDHLMEGDLARTYPDRFYMEISNSIYEAAIANDGASNYTLAHEIGHQILHRNIDPSFAFAKTQPKYESYFNSEWQADCFADYFLMPTYDVKATCTTVDEIMERYCVSKKNATKRFRQIFGEPQKINQKKEKGQLALAFDFSTKS